MHDATNHRYFLRSSIKKSRNPFNTNNIGIHNSRHLLGQSKETELSWGNGGGDVKQNINISKEFSIPVSSIVLIQKSKMEDTNETNHEADENYCRNYAVILLRIILFLGVFTILVANLVDSNYMKSITNDIDRLQTALGKIDSKLNRFMDKILNEIKNTQAEVLEKLTAYPTKETRHVLSNEDLKDFVKKELDTFSADKTGLPDFALESAGGSIVSTRNTKPYVAGSSMLSLFGIPVCSGSNCPRSIIQPSTLPGECWAIKGQTGAVVIQLLGDVVITGVSLEHIPASLSPTGEIKTAPKDFSILGMNKPEDDGEVLGMFTYDITQSPVQYFSIPENNKSFRYVELRIHSNHGDPEYTCIYRLRVHGELAKLSNN